MSYQSTPSEAPAGTLSSFDELTQRSTELAAEIQRISAKRSQTNAELCQLLRSRMKLHRELFQPLVPDYLSRHEQVHEKGFLEYWEVEEGDFIGEVGYGSRGMACSDRFRVPVRYMAADGESVIRAEAAALVAAREARAQRESEENARTKRARDLADLERLEADTNSEG